MPTDTIAVTRHLSVTNASHIVYEYTEESAYLSNVISFIEMGIQLGQRIIVIERPSRWEAIRTAISSRVPEAHRFYDLVDADEFYLQPKSDSTSFCEAALEHLQGLTHRVAASGDSVRMWGHVPWSKELTTSEELIEYELQSHDEVIPGRHLTVCAYDVHCIPASAQLGLLRTHPFLMTDSELVPSPLYQEVKPHTTVFPTLSTQAHMESEVDLFKRKFDFVNVVSHEVRNPLTVIHAYASLLAREEPDEVKKSKLHTILDYTKVIDHEVSHIIATEQMLSGEAVWEREQVPVLPILQRVVQMMRIKGRTEGIQLEVDIDRLEDATCYSNPLSLRLIFSNLISNAIKYSHEFGSVRVTGQLMEDTLCVGIADDGIGMSSTQQASLFRRYGKMNHDKSGQGIGLFMVKKLVDELGGSIEVSSTLGKGTHITVRLPHTSA